VATKPMFNLIFGPNTSHIGKKTQENHNQFLKSTHVIFSFNVKHLKQIHNRKHLQVFFFQKTSKFSIKQKSFKT